jgi:hypothetical protein
MFIASRPQLGRRRFMCACCAGTFIASAPAPARAADEVVVPVAQEPRHHTRFNNEYLRIIEAIIEPGDQSLFHKHALDTVVVTAHGAKLRVEKLGDPQAWIGQGETGHFSYWDYQAHPLIHRVAVLDDHAAVWWCDQNQIGQLADIEPLHVAAYIEALGKDFEKPTVKQHLAAIRMLFDWLVTGQIVATNPAHAVRGPKHVVKTGKTTVLDAEQARLLLDSTTRFIGFSVSVPVRPAAERKRGALPSSRMPAASI